MNVDREITKILVAKQSSALPNDGVITIVASFPYKKREQQLKWKKKKNEGIFHLSPIAEIFRDCFEWYHIHEIKIWGVFDVEVEYKNTPYQGHATWDLLLSLPPVWMYFYSMNYEKYQLKTVKVTVIWLSVGFLIKIKF